MRKHYYEQVDELREEIEAKLRAWSKVLEGSQAKAEGAEAAAKTVVERLYGAIQAQVRDLQPLIKDLSSRAEQAEKEAKRVVKEWRAKREPAKAALGDLKVGIEKAWGELRNVGLPVARPHLRRMGYCCPRPLVEIPRRPAPTET